MSVSVGLLSLFVLGCSRAAFVIFYFSLLLMKSLIVQKKVAI